MRNQAQATVVFDALGDPVRRRILELLSDGPSAVHELAERLPVNRPAVSKHLRVLSDAGLTEHRSVGTSNVYYLRREGLDAARAWLDETWEGVLAAFAQAARAEAAEAEVKRISKRTSQGE
jgi:DNA-binding transcriptional ArsR family regulator